MRLVFLFDIDGLKDKANKLEKETYDENFWDDVEAAQKTMQEIKGYKNQIEEYEDLRNAIEDLEVLIELALEEEDFEIYKEIKINYEKVSKEAENLKLATLLNGEYDKSNAIFSIHSGAGGLEAQDWAEMLFRMYKR